MEQRYEPARDVSDKRNFFKRRENIHVKLSYYGCRFMRGTYDRQPLIWFNI